MVNFILERISDNFANSKTLLVLLSFLPCFVKKLIARISCDGEIYFILISKKCQEKFYIFFKIF